MCSSDLQGVEYYRNADPSEDVPGLMHVVLGDYHVGDVEFVAAFDVDAAKVGLDLGKAIHASQNNTIKFANVGHLGVEVQRAPTFDGLGTYYREEIEESPAAPVIRRRHRVTAISARSPSTAPSRSRATSSGSTRSSPPNEKAATTHRAT